MTAPLRNYEAVQGGVPAPVGKSPSVSIVIPFVRPKELAATLRSLGKCNNISQAEVIAIGDGVVVDAEEHLDVANLSFDLRVIVIEKCGTIGRLRNIGVDAARSDTIYFVDSDCIVDACAIDSVLQLGDCAVAIGKINFFGKTILSDLDARIRSVRYRSGQFAYCPNLVIRRRLFEELGRFDERFRYGSDGEFAYRISISEVKVAYCPSILMLHDCTSPAWDIVRKWAKYGEGRFYRNLKHHRAHTASDYFPGLFDRKMGISYNMAVLGCNLARIYGFLRAYLAVNRGRGVL
ncbi:MAG: glycosyltransferase family 2 protein [Allosphingosinicella sp.]